MKIWKFFIERRPMVDQQLLVKKISLISEYHQFLGKNKKSIIAKNLQSDFKLLIAVAYSLQTIVQACIDICTHIASDQRWELPDSSAHALKIAQRHQVISPGISEELQKAVKLRNVIVHQYDELDTKILEKVVQKKLVVFSRFQQEILAWIKKK